MALKSTSRVECSTVVANLQKTLTACFMHSTGVKPKQLNSISVPLKNQREKLTAKEIKHNISSITRNDLGGHFY